MAKVDITAQRPLTQAEYDALTAGTKTKCDDMNAKADELIDTEGFPNIVSAPWHKRWHHVVSAREFSQAYVADGH